MRAVCVRDYGPPEVLRIEQVGDPRPAAGQVLVQVELASVIYGDVIVRSGRYPLELPWIPGTEVGGRVLAVGDGVDARLAGSRVVATTLGNTGGYAELAAVAAADAFALPDGLPLPIAMASFQAGAVALGLLAAARVAAGERVVVTAAAGRVGSVLVQLAAARGATVIAAAAGPDKVAAAAALGAEHVVDYSEPGWPERVRAATGGAGADVVLDAVGGTIGEQALTTLADGRGRFGIYGFASGTWVPLDALVLSRRGLTVMGALGMAFAKPAAEQRAEAERALRAAAAGRLRPRIHATFGLERAADAHAELEARRNVGAILLDPDGSGG
jgi:NADPH2:quinone reductase